jgi:C1A family cysteine protease
MHGVRGISTCIFFLVLISGFIFPAVIADQATNITSLVTTTNPTEVTTTIPTEVPTTVLTEVPTTVPSEVLTTVPTEVLTAIPTEVLTTAPAAVPTTVPTKLPTTVTTIIETTQPEKTATPTPPETLAVTTAITEPTLTLNNTLNETQINLENSSREILGTQKGFQGQAPMNPAFLEYQNRTKQSPAITSRMVESSTLPSNKGYTTTITLNDGSITQVSLEGEIPAPIDFSYTQGQPVSLDAASLDGGSPLDGSGYPSSYDLRNYNRVTPVKNQGAAGSCWAFATIASLESSLLPGESWDFSENNMKNTLAYTYTNGFDRTWDGGGNREMSTAYLTRWSGPVLESDDPYSDTSGTSPAGLHTYKHVQNVSFIPVRSSSTDNTNIKNALMNTGAVQASILYNNSYYKAGSSYGFYNDGSLIGLDPYQKTSTSTNHAITIVGWDDSYSSANFTKTPGGNGAFIVKNSWGSNWGNSGYFYISYYDLTIGNYCTAFTGEPATNYDRVYSYDPLGWVGSYGYSSTSAQYANVYTAESVETLNAIGTYTPSSGSYTVKIYLDPSGGPINSTGPVAQTSWSNTWPGYQTINVPDVALKAGQKYSIVILATTTGYTYPVPIEYPESGYSSHATANAGESYVSSNGATWNDMTSVYSNTNVCIKGYTTITSKSGVFRGGVWYLDYNGNGVWDATDASHLQYLGLPSDQYPVVGDWNGDGKDEVGVFRGGVWYLDYNGNGEWDATDASHLQYLGLPSDQYPIIGKWD